MLISNKYFATFVFLILTVNIFALDIDEKLTLRFLKVSNSKKTILINRGSEDGLVVGDHAKFYITSGIVARGMVEKVSPSRSIWALYRVVAPDEITDNKVLNLKIASPVKVTGDVSKSLKEENIPVSKSAENTENVENSSALSDKMGNDDKKELEDLGIVPETKDDTKVDSKEDKKVKETSKKASLDNKKKVNNSEEEIELAEVPSQNSSKTWEIFGTLAVNSQSGTTTDANSNSTSASASTTDLTFGIEKYFFNSTNFFKDVSLIGFFNRRSSDLSITSVPGSDTRLTSSWLEYGGGLNYHFYNSPASTNRLIGYGTVTGGIGSSSNSFTLTDTTTSSSVSNPVNGSSNFFSVGAGVKYILSNHFGVRGQADYFISKESFSYSNGSTINRSLAGPRIQMGLSWRF